MSLYLKEADYKAIKEKLLTVEFRDLLKGKVKDGLRLYKSNPELVKLVSEYLDVPEHSLSPYWNKLFMLIMKIYYGKVRVKQTTNLLRVRVNTLANSLYFILYDVYGTEATKLMYNIIEPYLVPVLSGEEDFNKARLFFVPLSTQTLDGVINLFREIISSNKKVLCRIPLNLYYTICSQSSLLPSSSNGRGGVEKCGRLIRKTYTEVCSSE